MTSKAYAQALYNTAVADGTFLPLLIMLEHVIEHNVAIPRLINSKRVFIRQVEVVAEHTSISLTLSEAQAREVVKTMGVLLIGATRADQGPSLDNEELPEDVQDLIASFSNAAFKDITHTQFSANLLYFYRLAFIGERGITGNYEHLWSF